MVIEEFCEEIGGGGCRASDEGGLDGAAERYRSMMIAQPHETDRHRAYSRTSADMDVAYISALSALAGSVIGGLTSGVTTWLLAFGVLLLLALNANRVRGGRGK